MMNLLDTIRLTVDLPDHGLRRGALGVIVLIHETPQLAYEVEFTNDEGETIAQCALLPSQLTPVR